MKVFALVVREMAGLFVDDEFLAAAMLAVVGLAGANYLATGRDLVTGDVLLIGCVAVLVLSIMRTSRRT